jgi:site-specific DNA recombinase
MRAALYARYSTDKQSEASIEDQHRVCERLADREGFRVVARFEDRAISGGTSDRPGYQSMLQAARRREFDVIVAEDSSRLWRELSEQWRALKELADIGISVVGHGLDTRRDESKILLAVNGAMAEAYRDEIARRTHRGLEGRARAGRPTGGKAYGYVAARDSGTGNIEIEPTQAAVVRRIFEMYADGASPRSIAATLNEEGVPSPGSSWNRTQRRTRGWLASAIHGDPNRGTGILNNPRYVGRIVWGRSKWTRGASDSSVRRMKIAPKPLHESEDERLRIVPQEVWNRVKARQAATTAGRGATIRRALRQRKAGAGRPAKHLLSGLLACGVCGNSFVLRNRASYACGSYWNGRACTNSLNVSRQFIEGEMTTGIQEDLECEEVVRTVEGYVREGLKRATRPKADPAPRIAALQQEIANLADAVAAGLLRSSPALAARLAAAEDELARLQTDRKVRPAVGVFVGNIPERIAGIAARLKASLQAGGDRAREGLRSALGERISLTPDASGGFLWADYSLGLLPLIPGAEGKADLMVAGVGFEPTTFGL